MVLRRKKHQTWSNRWTFIMAATGAAVGLGNIWKFPYIAGENGGGAFILVYLLCIAAVGLPIMLGEVVLGRRGRQNPIDTMRHLALEAGATRAWVGLGWLGIAAGLLILSVYGVVAGWALEYVFSLGGGRFQGVTAETAQSMFATLLADQSELIKWQSVFLLMTVGVVVGGVGRGVGRAVNLLMPLLMAFLLLLLAYGIWQGDFAAALRFLFEFDFQHLTWNGVLLALGHAFFSLSVGMGSMMVFGAYMTETASVGKSVVAVAVLDTLVGLLAGLAIFPIVFANPSIQLGEGPGLMFVTLPVAFGNMPIGQLFGTVFFLLVTVAAWSSSIALLEPAVAWLVESRQFGRIAAALLLGAVTWLVGLGTVYSFNDWRYVTPFFGMNFFDFLDFLTTHIMLPLSGILLALFVGWVMRPEHVRQELRGETVAVFERWMTLLKFVSPLGVLVVFVASLYIKFSTP